MVQEVGSFCYKMSNILRRGSLLSHSALVDLFILKTHIAFDTGVPRETDVEETVMLCCVTANGVNAVGQPALIFILKQVSLWDKKLS